MLGKTQRASSVGLFSIFASTLLPRWKGSKLAARTLMNNYAGPGGPEYIEKQADNFINGVLRSTMLFFNLKRYGSLVPQMPCNIMRCRERRRLLPVHILKV